MKLKLSRYSDDNRKLFQRECIYALSRSCAVAAMKCHSSYHYLRLLLLQLLSPLLSHHVTNQSSVVSHAADSGCNAEQSSSHILETKKKTEIPLPEGMDLTKMVCIFSNIILFLDLKFFIPAKNGKKQVIENKGSFHF